MSIGDNIRRYRKALGLTQAKLGELSGIHPVTIRKYETNKSVPLHAQVLKLAEALEISYGFLYDGNGMQQELKTDATLNMIMQLFQLSVLIVDGKRNDENCTLAHDSLSIKVSPTMAELFDLHTASGGTVDLDGITLCMKNKAYLNEVLKWEKLDYIDKQHELFKTRKPADLKKTWPAVSDEMISILQKCSVQTFGRLFFPQAFVEEK